MTALLLLLAALRAAFAPEGASRRFAPEGAKARPLPYTVLIERRLRVSARRARS